ncbi:MAG: ATP-binding protein [Lachnospiraceae bacterium]|nr:ATP-binding protein [Lachnospiraceae bacterium]
MVIANLLDNAFDCVKDFDRQEKQVNAKIQCNKNHGLGMQSVKAFSDKIGGSVSCYSEDDMFHIILFAKFS